MFVISEDEAPPRGRTGSAQRNRRSPGNRRGTDKKTRHRAGPGPTFVRGWTRDL